MKRDPRLAGLSSEHHRALVLARALTAHPGAWTAVDGAALGRRFEAELEPHFRVEDELLLPALRCAGNAAAALAERTAADHAFLRAQLAAARAGDGAAADAFAARLVEHGPRHERLAGGEDLALLEPDVLDEVARRAPKRP